MLRHVMAQSRVVAGEGPIGLVMAPTRELAMQIYSDYKKFSKTVGFTVCDLSFLFCVWTDIHNYFTIGGLCVWWFCCS